MNSAYVPFKIGNRELVARVFREPPEYNVGFKGSWTVEEILGVSASVDEKLRKRYEDLIIDIAMETLTCP